MIVLRRLSGLPFARFGDLSIIIVATAGLMFFWSQYSYLSGLSWWYGSVHHLRTGSDGRPAPDYDLATLPWRVAAARVFDLEQGRLTLVTSHDSFAYQASAKIGTGGARAADIQFDVDVEAGGVISSSRKAGSFADWNSAQLGYRRSLTVVIANDNPAGESRLIVKSLRLYLRK